MLKNLAGQALFFFIIFNLISWIRESALLASEEMAPSFELASVNGQQINSADLKGKPTLLYFWAPWCTVCKVSLPNLQNYYQGNKEDVNVISIALSYEQVSDVHSAIVKHKLSFPTLLGNEGVANAYKISGFPTYYLLDKKGQVVSKSLGYSTQIGMELRTLIL